MLASVCTTAAQVMSHFSCRVVFFYSDIDNKQAKLHSLWFIKVFSDKEIYSSQLAVLKNIPIASICCFHLPDLFIFNPLMHKYALKKKKRNQKEIKSTSLFRIWVTKLSDTCQSIRWAYNCQCCSSLSL